MKLAVVLICVMLLLGCRITSYRAEQTRQLMGTMVTVTVIADDEATARTAVNEAFIRMQRVESLMSIYDSDSEVYRLNHAKLLPRPDPSVVAVINRSLFYSRLSDGAFDITVQPVLDLYAAAAKENRTPTDGEVAIALKHIGHDLISVSGDEIAIAANMSITLGGIAKGYAVDSAIEVLQRLGIERALVNAGGNMRAIGTKELFEPWTVALQDPRNASSYITRITLDNRSISTSGDYERYFINKSYHHIIDPTTGHSADQLISVTLLAPTAMEADALSTTVFVLGPERGMALVEQLPHTEALLITPDRQVLTSSGWPS